MQFIKKIRENLGLNQYQAAKQMQFKKQESFAAFERAKEKVSLRKLVKFWRLSGMSGKAFLEMVEEEVMQEAEEE